jgi:hypothetical protein
VHAQNGLPCIPRLARTKGAIHWWSLARLTFLSTSESSRNSHGNSGIAGRESFLYGTSRGLPFPLMSWPSLAYPVAASPLEIVLSRVELQYARFRRKIRRFGPISEAFEPSERREVTVSGRLPCLATETTPNGHHPQFSCQARNVQNPSRLRGNNWAHT